MKKLLKFKLFVAVARLGYCFTMAVMILSFAHMMQAFHSLREQTSTASSSPSPTSTLLPMGVNIPHPAGTMLTSQQVLQYVETHTFWVGPTVSGRPFTVRAVQLMTAQQAYQQEHADSLGVPDSELVYYVYVVGPFKPEYISSPHPLKVKSVPGGYEIWDAYSGNLLEAGL